LDLHLPGYIALIVLGVLALVLVARLIQGCRRDPMFRPGWIDTFEDPDQPKRQGGR